MRTSQDGSWRGAGVVAALAAVLALGPACGGGNGPGPADEGPGDDLPLLDADGTAPGDESGRDLAGTDATPIHRYEILLLHDLTQAETLLTAHTLTVRAKVFDYAQGVPAAGMNVCFAITAVEGLDGNPTDDWDGSLETECATTDSVGANAGMATDLFRAGLAADRRYTITVSLPDDDAAPRSLDILVMGTQPGCMDVSLKYEGALSPATLADIDVYVLPEAYDCGMLDPANGAPAPEIVLADRRIPIVGGTTTIEGLPAETRYTVWALAHRKGSDCVVAQACREGVYVAPSATCESVELALTLVALQPTGIYDCIDHFDFSDLVEECAGDVTSPLDCVTSAGDVGKTVCCALNQTITLFTDPGTLIINSLFDVARLWIGSLIVDTVENALGILKDAIAKIVTKWLLENSPPWLQQFFDVGQDMVAVVTNLEMQSTLTLSKVQNNFTMRGDQAWTGVTLYWKLGCDPASPDYDCCGRLELDLKNIADPNFPLKVLAGNFTAHMIPFDTFLEDRHTIQLNYGLLVLYVIEDVFLKWVTGGKATSILEAAKLWIDCGAIANGILGEIASIFGGSTQDLELACEGAVDGVFGFANTFLANLTLGTELSIEGRGRLVDGIDGGACDLKVDAIVDGVYDGYVQGQGNSQDAQITGDFHCVRRGSGAELPGCVAPAP